MIQRKLRFSALALSAAAVVPLVAATMSSCGPARDPGGEELSAVDGEYPYRNFRGGDVNGERNFAMLINKYPQAKHTGWAGSFWPYTANGIAAGVAGGNPTRGGGGYSPAGKYDAARGTRQTQDWEVRMHGAGVKGVQGWWGHCNGWCVASALFPEPRDVVKVNGIEFGVADLKGILSEAGMSASADFFGNRLDPWTREYNKAYNDTVADQYFLVLTNYMGKLGHPVLIDRYTGDQVWNQPLAGYRFQYPKKEDYLGCTGDARTGQVCKINLRSTVWWYNDSGVPADVITPEFNFEDNEPYIQHRDLDLELWVDAPIEFGPDGKITKSGNVIVTHDGDTFYSGGAWKYGDYSDGHPDYMWVPYSIVKPDPNDDYANPYIDIEWVKKHLLVPGGADDPSAHPSPIETAPSPRPSSSASPTPRPTTSTEPVPIPFPTFTTAPRPTSNPVPFPTFTSNPQPTMTVIPFPGGPGSGGSGSGPRPRPPRP